MSDRIYTARAAAAADGNPHAARATVAPAWLLILFIGLAFALAACTGEGESGDAVDDNTQILAGSAGGNTSTVTAGAGDSAPGGGGAAGAAAGIATFAAMPSPLSSLLPDLTITDFVVISTTRVGRTTMEYVLKLKLSNSGSTRYEKVIATIIGAPQHIAVIDGVAIVGEVPPNSTVLSQDTFTLRVDLAQSTSFDDIVWQVEGDPVTPPPPPPSGGPSAPGIYMNIDDLSIPGESKSESHRDWIELTNVMDGIRREGLGTIGTTRERASFSFDGIHLEKLIDRSSLKLREAILKGTIFTEVEIDIVKSCGGNPYTLLALTLGIARIDEFASTATSGEALPSESLGLNFTRIEVMYTPVEKDCTLGAPIYTTQDGEILSL